MNTRTPTANQSAAGALPGQALPAGLPDPGALARLASAFFAALPGQAVADAAPPDLAHGGRGVPPSATGLPHGAPASAPAASAGVPVAPPAGFPEAAPWLAVAGNPAPAGSPFAGPGGTGTGVPGLNVPAGKVPGANLAPAAPTHVLSLGNRAPALAPHAAAQNGLPDQAVSVAPALEPRFGGASLGVPQGHGLGQGSEGALVQHGSAAGVPGGVPSAPPSAGTPERPAGADGRAAAPASAPFYFLDDSVHGLPGGARDIALPSLGAVAPQGFGLPGEDDLRDLLPVRHRQHSAPSAQPSAGATQHYFLDERRANEPSARDGGLAPVGSLAGAHPPFDVNAIRRDFPILQERVNGKQLIWFDNAATTHKPKSVIDRLAYFYEHENSNIHRAAHTLAGRATDAYEHARDTVRRFIGAASSDEIVFVRGTTEAINLIAKSWGVQNVGEGDEIVVSNLEHHANIVPWQQLAASKGAKLRVIPVDDTGQVLLDEYRKLLNDRTRIVAVTQVSNALGTVVPVKEIVDLAHRAGAKALVDGAQSISHMRVDVQALDADFFVFSGHKIYGPTGIGVAYAKRAILDDMPPWQGGGNMIADVTFERTVFQPPPNRFEAGTGNIADAVGLGAALDYVERVGIEHIARYEHDLLAYATAKLAPVPGVRLVGTARDKASVLSFVLKGYTTEEVGQALNEEGVAVRSGHHCAQPILRRFGLETTVRPSLAFYNTCAEVDVMIDVVRRLSSARI